MLGEGGFDARRYTVEPRLDTMPLRHLDGVMSPC
jgi:hypothetical protein